jgi:hypothetical protein
MRVLEINRVRGRGGPYAAWRSGACLGGRREERERGVRLARNVFDAHDIILSAIRARLDLDRR